MQRLIGVILAACLFFATIPARAGDGAVQLTFGNHSRRDPAYSPDGSLIAFRQNSGLCTVPALGGELVQITSGYYHDGPAYSPNGLQIAHNDYSYGYHIELIPTHGGPSTRIVESGRNASWSPDGKMITFSSSAVTHSDIWVAPSTGGKPVRLTHDDVSDQNPAWSPDGTKIAFNTRRTGVHQIWVMPAEGGEPTQITHGFNGFAPAWSPDGARIAFTSGAGGNADIWTIPSHGGAATRLTTDPMSDMDAAWSPDGNWIAFKSSRGQSSIIDYEIWVILVRPPIAVKEESWGTIKGKFRE